MKRGIALLMALVMALALTACGRTQQQQRPVNGGAQQDVTLPAAPDEGYTAGSWATR